MRKDRIEEKAYLMALEMYSEGKGSWYDSQDPEDSPVMAPQTSKLAKNDKPFYQGTAFYNNKPVGAPGENFSEYSFSQETGTPEYDAMRAELDGFDSKINDLGGRLRKARQMGNFSLEHKIVQERNDLIKARSALQSQMMVNDLGRFQREQSDELGDFSEYIDAIEENDRRISDLEARFSEFLEFAEKTKKSPSGAAAADPGQTYTKADVEEDDDEEDEEELGDG